MISNTAAYYLWPAVWVGSRHPTSGTDIALGTFEEEVYRTTLSLGITVKILQEGMFIFDFSGWSPGKALPEHGQPDFDAVAAVILHRVVVLNTHLVCLYRALSHRQNLSVDKMIVNPSDIITLKSLDDTGTSFGDLRIAALALAHYPSTYAWVLPAMVDWRVTARSTLIEIETVDQSFKLLDTILQHPASHVLTVTDLYTRSCKAYEDHNYALCLVTAWAVIEKLLHLLWKRCVDENRSWEIDGAKVTFINKDRVKNLTNSHDFTAFVISEILSLSNALPFSLYQELSRVRHTRNYWLHDLKPVSREMAEVSARVAAQMLNLVDGLDLEGPLMSRIHE